MPIKRSFLGFFGWFLARSDRLMWHQAQSRPKSRVKQKSVVEPLFSVLPTTLSPWHTPARPLKGGTGVAQCRHTF